METLGHISDLFGDGVAVHHEYQSSGGGGESVKELAPDPLVTRHIHQLQTGLVLHREGHLVVGHGGVGLHHLPGDQLGEESGLAAVRDPTDQHVCNQSLLYFQYYHQPEPSPVSPRPSLLLRE